MDPREELQALRRLAELEERSGGQASANDPTSGGPVGPRRQNTPQQNMDRAMSEWNDLPWYARATIAPDEMLPGGREARTKASADAGAVVTNLIADATVNLPANVAGFAGKVAGQVGRNFDADIDPAKWREKATLWNLRTERGDEVMAEAAAPKVRAWQEHVSPWLNEHPIAGAAVETAGTFLEGLGLTTGGRGAVQGVKQHRAARAPINQTVLEGARPYLRAPVADVAKRYTVVPDDAQQSANLPTQGGMTGSTRAKFGAQVTDTEVPANNIREATRRATQDLPGQLLDSNGRVDAGLLHNALEAEAVPYKQIAQLPTPAGNTLAPRLSAAWEARGGSLRGDVVAESRLLPLLDQKGAPLHSKELLQRWREINGYASDLSKAIGEGSAAAQIKGRDLRAIADAILEEIDARAAEFAGPEMVDKLKTARVNLARLHALDDSLDSVGWLDTTRLRALQDGGTRLTGGLAEVSADAAAAPRSLAPLKKAVDAQGTELDQFGRQPTNWARNIAGHFGGNMLARRGIAALNQELRAGSGVLRQPEVTPTVPPIAPRAMGANDGPPSPVGPGRGELPEPTRWRLENPQRGNVMQVDPDRLRLGVDPTLTAYDVGDPMGSVPRPSTGQLAAPVVGFETLTKPFAPLQGPVRSLEDLLGVRDPSLAELVDEPATGLDAQLEPTSGLALDPVQPGADFTALLGELGLPIEQAPTRLTERQLAPKYPPAQGGADYAPARGFADLTRFVDEPGAAPMAQAPARKSAQRQTLQQRQEQAPSFVDLTDGADDIDLDSISFDDFDEASLGNNASGESAASMEAISRRAQERAGGRSRFMVDADDSITPLNTVDAVDRRARPGQVIYQRDPDNPEGYSVLDRGTTPEGHLRGLLARLKAQLDELE